MSKQVWTVKDIKTLIAAQEILGRALDDLESAATPNEESAADPYFRPLRQLVAALVTTYGNLGALTAWEITPDDF